MPNPLLSLPIHAEVSYVAGHPLCTSLLRFVSIQNLFLLLPSLTEVIYVAGDRVVTDALCKPFSMGRNLFCVHSKVRLQRRALVKRMEAQCVCLLKNNCSCLLCACPAIAQLVSPCRRTKMCPNLDSSTFAEAH